MVYARTREVLQHGVRTLSGPVAVKDVTLAAATRNSVQMSGEHKRNETLRGTRSGGVQTVSLWLYYAKPLTERPKNGILCS